MRVVLDACVLFPTVQRQLLTGMAAAGLFAPVWSERILEEWARACARLGAGPEVIARGESVQLRLDWPGAMVRPDPEADRMLDLPDPDDRHVLGSAIRSGAGLIVTSNLRDFPPRLLLPQGVRALDPDRFLIDLADGSPGLVGEIADSVRRLAEHLSGEPQPPRALMKRAGLPRFGKWLEHAAA